MSLSEAKRAFLCRVPDRRAAAHHQPAMTTCSCGMPPCSAQMTRHGKVSAQPSSSRPSPPIHTHHRKVGAQKMCLGSTGHIACSPTPLLSPIATRHPHTHTHCTHPPPSLPFLTIGFGCTSLEHQHLLPHTPCVRACMCAHTPHARTHARANGTPGNGSGLHLGTAIEVCCAGCEPVRAARPNGAQMGGLP